MATDSHLASAFVPSPNHDARDGDAVDILLLHYTGMASALAAQERLCDPAAKVSSHYMVDEDGTIVQMVSETRRAWHAGISFWQGATDINSRSIGIEIVNGGHDFDCPVFPSRQIDAVISLCRDIQSRRQIPPERVLAHSDIAPGRKRDPGEKFPWRALHQSGVGLWVEPEPVVETAEPLDASSALKLKAALCDYGYRLKPDDDEATTRDVVAAFQRHFRPQRVDGVMDVSTARTLARLMAAQADMQIRSV
ncbi:MAG TPA: N-acetylmuramoyl-L-alanine amidase [Afipia sp.]